MGVKGTIHLTRKKADGLFRKLRTQALNTKHYSDEELEALLEEMNDATHGGEGYENYKIEGGSLI